MKLNEVMRCPVVSVSGGATIRHAVSVMDRCGYGFLPVIEQGRAIGVVTGRDLAARSAGRGLCVDSTVVTVIMSQPAITLSGEYQLEDALVLMRQQNIRRLLIAENDLHVTGVVSLSDIAGHVTADSIAKTVRRHAEQVHPVANPFIRSVPGLYLG